ncbi:MAG: glycerol-3-phosphate acyltransferase [Heliobacteriaceae bacterium]|nr:glycerol-3-phosphate acyltransferase [Heliobacteriaceae bacterium]MDD4586799.1 glycerol-3-phosphate acyltransferase [Heliobacteriaceae bacterium]
MFSALMAMCAYLIGALPIAYWVGRLGYGLVRDDYGPGSIGPVKLLRLAGPESMALGWLGETTKGVVAGLLPGIFVVSPACQWLAGLFLMVGHGWSPVLQGRGGNSWVPFCGFLFVQAPELAQFALAAAVAGLVLSRSSSLAASTAMLTVCVLGWLVETPVFMALVLTLAAAIVIFQNWLVFYHQMAAKKI